MGNAQGKASLDSDAVHLDHFKLLRVVGKGAFGKVRIVERKDNGLTFALKYIRKEEVVRQENVRNIIRERKMLEHLNHPFLCNLRYSFQDYEYLYLVVDLMTGGDLRFHITRKTFEERTIRFWMAELGCALRYVHSQGIVHRDVKPDNVLLDGDGHVHLADFNVAADYTNPRRPLSSKSGTLAYLAPEVYEEGTYKCEVDWWSLGVVLYECIYGKRPFDGRSQEELGTRIKAAQVKYPLTEPRVEGEAVSAIQCLLCKNTSQRIGANSWEKFIDHPFFSPIDFDKLERKQIEPIFIPSSDKTNFDATYDLEELLLEEAPLEARARHQKPRPKLKENATEQEKRAAELHSMIEKYFEPFDYTVAVFDKVSSETRASSSAGKRAESRVRELEKLVTDDASPSRSQTPGPGSSSPTGDSQGSNPGTRIPMRETSPAPQHHAVTYSPKPLQRSGSSGGNVLQKTVTPSSDATGAPGSSRTRGASRTDNTPAMKNKKGFAGLLSKARDRGKSPAGRKYPEGVLGKEGCRVWVKE